MTLLINMIYLLKSTFCFGREFKYKRAVSRMSGLGRTSVQCNGSVLQRHHVLGLGLCLVLRLVGKVLVFRLAVVNEEVHLGGAERSWGSRTRATRPSTTTRSQK